MRFWYGNVTVEIKGYKPEKFINIAAKRNLFFKNVKCLEKNKLHGDIDFDSYKKLRPVAYKSRCRMHVIRKRGKIFLARKLRKRMIFFIEGICAFILLIFLSGLIGDIQVNVPAEVSKYEILEMLYENGVYEGVHRSSIDDEFLAKKIMLEFEDISWAEVTINGMQLKIDASKSVPAPKAVPYKENCNLVASKDGVIKEMNIKNGTASVKQGDTVRAGDIIVSSVMKNRFDENKFYKVHAHGEVLASTWYREEQVVNTVKINRKRTEEYFENTQISILGLSTGRLFERKVKYEEYDITTQKDQVLLLGFIKLPVYVTKQRYYECAEEAENISGDEALEIAKNKAYQKCMSRIPDTAEIKDVKFSVESIQNDGICAVVIVECIENIAIEKNVE